MANAKGSLSHLRFVESSVCKFQDMKVAKEAREITMCSAKTENLGSLAA